VQGIHFGVGKDIVKPSARLLSAIAAIRIPHPQIAPPARGKRFLGLLMGQNRNAHLLQVVFALDVAGRLPGGIHGRQEHAYEDADDCDNNEQFHKGKTALLASNAASVATEHRISPH
jgi:hypothetical protein